MFQIPVEVLDEEAQLQLAIELSKKNVSPFNSGASTPGKGYMGLAFHFFKGSAKKAKKLKSSAGGVKKIETIHCKWILGNP